MKPALKVAMCGISTALSVLILFLGGILPLLAYISPMITGVLMIILVSTFGYASAWVTYIATSVLSVIMVPDKECMLMYVLFFGYYTIIRIFLAKIKPAFFRYAAKLVIFNAALAAVNVILFYVFGIPFFNGDSGIIIAIVFVILMNSLFLMYEKLLSALMDLYKLRIEKRIKHIIK